MNILPGNMRFGAGQPVKRLEDQRLLTGKGAFIDDKPEDGALWLHVLRSPHAHAKIRSIDTAAAAAMAGVSAVFTGADLIFACACGERSTCSHSAPSSGLSSMNCPFPVSSRSSSRRLTGCPAPKRILPGRMFISLSVEFLGKRNGGGFSGFPA